MKTRIWQELRVATIDFIDTFPHGYNTSAWTPSASLRKSLRSIWRAIDLITPDRIGHTPFVNATIRGSSDLRFGETLARCTDVDVNVQDASRCTALHWACHKGLYELIGLCLSLPSCVIGLQAKDGHTAFYVIMRIRHDRNNVLLEHVSSGR